MYVNTYLQTCIDIVTKLVFGLQFPWNSKPTKVISTINTHSYMYVHMYVRSYRCMTEIIVMMDKSVTQTITKLRRTRI